MPSSSPPNKVHLKCGQADWVWYQTDPATGQWVCKTCWQSEFRRLAEERSKDLHPANHKITRLEVADLEAERRRRRASDPS